MKAIDLTKIASYLFRQPPNHKRQDLMHEIYAITKGLHPKDEVKIEFSKELQDYLKNTNVKEITETAGKLFKIAQFLKKNDHQSELSKKIFKAVKNVPKSKDVTVPLTLNEFLVIESLEN